MKQIKIPFSLSEFQKGGYDVMTRGDKNRQPVKVRIICTNRMDNTYSLIVLLKDGEEEYSFYYSNDGKYIIGQESYCDLVLVKQEFEDGDIITRQYSDMSFIFPYRGTNEGGVLTEVFYCTKNCDLHYHSGYDTGCGYTKDCRLATEEEKQLFFNALKKEGKQWNAETKQIEDIKKEYEFHLKDWCLMRCEIAEQWTLCQFSHVYDKNWVVAVGGNVFSQCIPYNEETKDLLGTTDDCPDKYKTWLKWRKRN